MIIHYRTDPEGSPKQISCKRFYLDLDVSVPTAKRIRNNSKWDTPEGYVEQDFALVNGMMVLVGLEVVVDAGFASLHAQPQILDLPIMAQ